MGKVRHYRDLDVWRRGMDIAIMVYRITSKFPESERYGLTNQIRRAAVSDASALSKDASRLCRKIDITDL